MTPASKPAMPLPSVNLNALRLDPFRPLTAADRAQLAAAGLDVLTVSTLDELQAAIAAAPSQTLTVVLGLGADIELLQDTLALIHTTGRTLPLVCRTERRQLELAVLALHSGRAGSREGRVSCAAGAPALDRWEQRGVGAHAAASKTV